MNIPRDTANLIQRVIDNLSQLHVNIEQAAQTASAQTLRSAAVLTTDYVNSNSVLVEHYDKASLLIAFTKGSLTSCEMQVQFSPDDVTWYTETDAAYDGHSVIEHVFTVSGNYILGVDLADKYMRIRAKGTGTVTGSSLAIAISGR